VYCFIAMPAGLEEEPRALFGPVDLKGAPIADRGIGAPW